MTAFTIGQPGLSMIKHFEGCVLHTYLDSVGVPTIGWGITGPEARPGRVITQAQADQMLIDRINTEFVPGVNKALGNSSTTHNQFDAMVSLSYNIGLGAFRSSSVLRDHLAGRLQNEKVDFEKWDKAGGEELDALLRRRDAEYALYATPDAAPVPGPAVPPVQPSPEPVPADPVLIAFHKASVDMQQDLRDRGYYDGTVDGWFGPRSWAALRAYSKDLG